MMKNPDGNPAVGALSSNKLILERPTVDEKLRRVESHPAFLQCLTHVHPQAE